MAAEARKPAAGSRSGRRQRRTQDARKARRAGGGVPDPEGRRRQRQEAAARNGAAGAPRSPAGGPGGPSVQIPGNNKKTPLRASWTVWRAFYSVLRRSRRKILRGISRQGPQGVGGRI